MGYFGNGTTGVVKEIAGKSEGSKAKSTAQEDGEVNEGDEDGRVKLDLIDIKLYRDKKYDKVSRGLAAARIRFNIERSKYYTFENPNLYLHFQVGGGKPLNINMSSVDFSGTSQKELELTGMKAGDVRPVNLFNAGPLNQAALAFGRVNIKAHGNNQFSIIGGDESSQFNFSPLIDPDASFGRNAGNLLGAGINYNVFPSLILRSPIPTLVPLIFGGPFDIHFNGTTTIPK